MDVSAWSRAVRSPQFIHLDQVVSSRKLATVCRQTACPKLYECWLNGAAALQIGGQKCTRSCGFCPVATGTPPPLDGDEPRRVAAAISQMDLGCVSISSVARDDLPDGGAWLFAQTIREVRRASPKTQIEVLVPDFGGYHGLLEEVIDAKPDVLGHQLQAAQRVFGQVRDGFSYRRSLGLLAQAKAAGLSTRSNLLVGLGETKAELTRALTDLRAASCDVLTISQYVSPTPDHLPVSRQLSAGQWASLLMQVKGMGFTAVAAGRDLPQAGCFPAHLLS